MCGTRRGRRDGAQGSVAVCGTAQGAGRVWVQRREEGWCSCCRTAPRRAGPTSAPASSALSPPGTLPFRPSLPPVPPAAGTFSFPVLLPPGSLSSRNPLLLALSPSSALPRGSLSCRYCGHLFCWYSLPPTAVVTEALVPRYSAQHPSPVHVSPLQPAWLVSEGTGP